MDALASGSRVLRLSMFEWVISVEERIAYLDLRDNGLDFEGAERLLEAIQPYLLHLDVGRIVVEVLPRDPHSGPVEMLIVSLGSHARTTGFAFEVRGTDELLERRDRLDRGKE
jgi:hypothetical protein